MLGRNLGGPRRGWWRWLQWQWWGLDLAWNRWWLSFDQTAQTAWLNQLLGSNPNWIGWLVLAGGALAFALGLRVTRWRAVATPIQRTLRLLETLDVTPQPGESFAALCHRAAASTPSCPCRCWPWPKLTSSLPMHLSPAVSVSCSNGFGSRH
ncbi:hypothetical protein [Parasynechococcus marenigrum]|uniref:Uncharacterized protein n=1 Tax=Parasynechococcus marenigrum (strain WH8102) TaxID=84588 RepID=Q7U9Z2_PARMW|nr:hypothetical protein [Parasynechococcus marenigrum]CAE06625.1 hypothetical [Parasynechococcus marenigrum WH 8102]